MCRIFMPLAFAGFFASTLVRQTASAFLLGSCFFLLLNAVIFWGFGHPKITIGGHLFWEGALGPQLMIALMCVILPWLAWRNYCDTRGVIENCRRTFVVSYISLFVAPTLLAPAIYHRLWEFVTPAAAHGAARLSQNQAPTIDGADELVLTFPDGRLWRGGLDFSKSDDSRVPVGILGQGFEEGSNWVKAVGSLYAICALRNDGTLWFARGGDFLKPYPDDQPIRTYEPLVRSDREDDWSDILLLDTTPFLLKRDGSLWIGGSTDVTHWTGTLKFEPRRLETVSDWKRLFIVAGEPCVEKTDGVTWSLVRWWENRGDKYGNVQLRQDFRIYPHPLLAGLDVSRWRSLDFGGQTAEGIRDDGTFWSWGKVSDDWSSPDSAANANPVQIGTDTAWRSIAECGGMTLLLRADGTIWKWNRSAALEKDPLRKIDSHSDWIGLKSTWWGTVALTADGGLWRWETESSSSKIGPFNLTLTPSRRPIYLGNIFDGSTPPPSTP
jgi:hypothetical protein